MHYEQAKESLINGKTREAIDMLREPLEKTPLYDEWMMVRARYETLREREMKGLLSAAEAQLEHNRINDAVLRLLDKAAQKEEVPVVRQQATASTVPPKQGLPKWATMLIAAVVAVGALLFIRGQFGATQEPAAAQTERKIIPETKEAPESASVTPEKKPDTKPNRVTPETKTIVPPNRSVAETKINEEASRTLPEAVREIPKTDLKKAVALQPGALIAKYDVSKISGNRDLPFEIHTLTHHQNMILMEMTLTNRTGKPVKLGEMEMLHTGDRSVGKSQSLNGTMLEAGDKMTETFRFAWAIPGELRAFRMKMAYAIQGGDGIRALKTDFGLYKKIQ
jgi:hypothetical protein